MNWRDTCNVNIGKGIKTKMESIEWWTMIPFFLMLLCIAVLPLCAPKWWEKNTNKLLVSALLGIPSAVYMVMNGMGGNLEHQILFDYIPFIVLLLALYVVTGGIYISGVLPAKPWVNTCFLAVGYLLASIMGTTGAAMLLIRPLINTIRHRHFKTHTVLFFIATVANCGGLLTPLGDPPLFMLYLRGAEFTWVLELFPVWLVTGVLLLGTYFVVDTFFYRRERKTVLDRAALMTIPLGLHGKRNIVFLVLVILSVAFLNENHIPSMGGDAPFYMRYIREYALLAIALVSWLITGRKIRTRNQYSWAPIVEIAYLFIGIFVTMTPALLFLNAHAASLGLQQPWQYFYTTGALSSVLDNTPTALAFHTVALGLSETTNLVVGVPESILKAIAAGAVFFGAMTYIGNGPNFMVKAIAEEHHIKMPSFFVYIFKFSLIVLLPIYVIVQWIFF